MSVLFSIESLGGYEQIKPYYPYPVAVEKGILSYNTAELDTPLVSPGQELMRGRIPNSKQAGMISIAGGKMAAFDHTAAEFHGKLLKIMPANKDAVSDEGEIQDPGMVILETDDGRLKIVALALRADANPWLTESMVHEFPINRNVGRIAMFGANTLDLPEYEIKDVNSQTGIVTATPRFRLY